jgi:glycosyltransferase involved in cell wall biosynthesis
LRVVHLSTADLNGGAARAAYRIHKALQGNGIQSEMVVNEVSSGDLSVHGPAGKLGKASSRLRCYIASPLKALLHTGNPVLHTPAIVPSGWPGKLNASDADVVHLHALHDEMLSIADIGRINKPLVWTLHDMWAFCGAEHYSDDGRWRRGYWPGNRPTHESGFDLNRWAWLRKRKHWRRPISIVTPSRWLADCASSSLLMHDWPVTVVPNCLDTDRWQPLPQSLARQLLGLPADGPLLLFGAIGGSQDLRKGFDLLLEALAQLRQRQPSLQLVVFGELAPANPPDLGFSIHYTGHLHDDLSLRALYSAADLFVLPSRQDNFPNTALEAQACGTPVVAFRTGGIPDIVEHQSTGYLAQPYDPHDLAAGIAWVLEDSLRYQTLGIAARNRAEQLWNPARVASLYLEVYRIALG